MFLTGMAFTTLFKKATNLLGINSSGSRPPPLDGEIIYCKNNVCVHPPAPLSLDVEHYPGYLTLRSIHNDISNPTLILTWIPNSTLKRNPYSIENSPNRSDNITPKQSPYNQNSTLNHAYSSPNHGYSRTCDTTSTSSQNTSPGKSSACSGKVPNSVSEFSLTRDIDSWSVTSDSAVALESRSEHDDLHVKTEENSCVNLTDRQLSSSAKSQTDSGICEDDNPDIQNNELLSENISKAPTRIGIKVNKLNASKNTNLKHGAHLGTVTGDDDDEALSSDSDCLTSEEQLAVLLNQNKLEGKESERERRLSNRSVCVEMDGEKLLVVTEEDLTHNRPPDINVNPGGTASFIDDPLSPQYVISPTSANTPFDLQQCAEIVENMKTVASYAKNETDPSLSNDISDYSTHCPVDKTSSLITNSDILDQDFSISRSALTSSSSTTTSGPDSRPPSPYSSPCNSEPVSPSHSYQEHSPGSPQYLKVAHNLTFPHNSIAYSSSQINGHSAGNKMCGVFSVDLAQMRSLRLFYSDSECTRGQVVIASRESQYKILHFHHAGLDKLAEIFEEWSLFAQSKVRCEAKTYKQFLIVRPQLTTDQCHPEDDLYGVVNEEMWSQHINGVGQIEDVHLLQKAIFFGGIEANMRQHIWPFLLQYYSFKSTTEQREHIRNDRYIAYHNIRKARLTCLVYISCTLHSCDEEKLMFSYPFTAPRDYSRVNAIRNKKCGS